MSIAKEVQHYSRLAYERFLVGAAGGNVSARDPESGLIAITATGISLRDITEENVIYVDLDGRVRRGRTDLRPSKETQLHLAIYNLRAEMNAVVHVHPTYSTAYSLAGKPIPIRTVSAENKIIQLPVIKKAQAGSPELVSYIVETMRGIPPTLRVLVLEAHGLLGFGETLSMAYDVTELAEETARVAAIAEGLGGSSYMTARVGGG